LQYEFYTQWYALKAYANEKKVQIIGDIPIYVAEDSADVWAHPELFQMDEEGNPKAVAGCPPDGFSATGQLWGNPLYLWEYHKKTGFAWWIQRIKKCNELYDMIRIDHFRGFDQYYSIPAGSENAVHGEWEDGPGLELFTAIKNALGELNIIAEDLGYRYLSASNKADFLNALSVFVDPMVSDSLILECFTMPQDESDALYAIEHIAKPEGGEAVKELAKNILGNKGIGILKKVIK
jgi:4-alpha-glucanotransferase